MPNLVAPPADGPLDPSWWAPLEAVARAIAGNPRYRFFDVADFMVMVAVVGGAPQNDVLLYKHIYTRHYLNLDRAGHAYRYAAPGGLADGPGSYGRHHSLYAALDALDLWELPWMKPGLEEHQCGRSWAERQPPPPITEQAR